MIQDDQALAKRSSPHLLVFLGGLWLVLAAGLLLYQFFRPVTVQIEWETATELNTAGFLLYRGQSLDGEFPLLTEELIPSQGSTVSGAKYTFEDNQVKSGETYYYILEEVEYNGSINRYNDDMFSYTVPRITWVFVFLTAVSILIGLALLLTGIKEGKREWT